MTTTIASPSSTSLALPRISVATRAGPPTRSIVATHAAAGCIADILADRAVGGPSFACVHGRAAAVAASTSVPMRAGPVLRAACNPTGRRRAAPRPAVCIADKLADRAAGQPGLVGACVWPVDRHGSCRPANSRTAAEPAAGSYRSLLGAGGGTAAPAARGARSCADKNACAIINGIAARLSAVHNVHEPSRVFRLPTQTRAGLPSSTVLALPRTSVAMRGRAPCDQRHRESDHRSAAHLCAAVHARSDPATRGEDSPNGVGARPGGVHARAAAVPSSTSVAMRGRARRVRASSAIGRRQPLPLRATPDQCNPVAPRASVFPMRHGPGLAECVLERPEWVLQRRCRRGPGPLALPQSFMRPSSCLVETARRVYRTLCPIAPLGPALGCACSSDPARGEREGP